MSRERAQVRHREGPTERVEQNSKSQRLPMQARALASTTDGRAPRVHRVEDSREISILVIQDADRVEAGMCRNTRLRGDRYLSIDGGSAIAGYRRNARCVRASHVVIQRLAQPREEGRPR